MPLNDDIVLGRMTDPKAYPGDSQEDLNISLLMAHDQNLLLKYVKKRIGRFTLEDLLYDLEECSDEFWEEVLIKIIKYYNLANLEMYLSDVKMANFSKHVIDLYRDLKITLIDDIVEQKIKRGISRDEFEEKISKYTSLLLRWSIKFITKEDYEKFISRVFLESVSPMYLEGDDE